MRASNSASRSLALAAVASIAAGTWLPSARAQGLQQKLEPADNQAGDWLGWSVALGADTALLGAFGDSSGAGHGSVYVYERTPGGWLPTQELLSSDPEGGHHFGINVALCGDTALVADP